jgi:hypothetical protein
MPVNNGRDILGPWYRWGMKNKKYYYTPGDPISRNEAHNAAIQQGRAIRANSR